MSSAAQTSFASRTAGESFAASSAVSPAGSHSRKVAPATSYPIFCSSKAAAELSTPPLIAIMIFLSVLSFMASPFQKRVRTNSAARFLSTSFAMRYFIGMPSSENIFSCSVTIFSAGASGSA